ncbi:DUF4389 domain-containing protein [Chloroflexota bacterium]
MAQQNGDYPVQLSVDYPDRSLDRFSSFFRLFAIIPIFIILVLVAGGSWGGESDSSNWEWTVGVGGILGAAPALMILFRQKYPRWWFDWNVELTKFSSRVTAYFFLLRDEYPSTDEEQSVHIDIPYPDVERDLNRWLPLVKWLLAIPHWIVLCFLWVLAFIVVVIVWFAILLTGRYPRSMFDFIVGVMRWSLRVEAYAIMMVTDQYPPFRLDP